MAIKRIEPPKIEVKQFQSINEIDNSVSKLQRRLKELNQLNVPNAVHNNTGEIKTIESNIRNTILEIFGENSPEYREHKHLELWVGPLMLGMSASELIDRRERGRMQAIGIVTGLINRLQEKGDDLKAATGPAPASYFDELHLHSRIAEASRDLFMDGHPWEAVFAGAKALINYVKERSGRHDLDGAALMRAVFSKNNSILAFNDLSDPTDLDEQEGMMHLFEGAVLGIRNPGGHSFPEGPDQRAIEYISLLSLLAYRTQEAKKHK